ncbi:MAG: hypothetical protein CYPHOPRED_005847 [Cyphobasidiales sp. Tagirdzhanova-0007]|nr:MAG: hypothetical protein CYPHOPRED_005847 [Cyphobasidiales sp. Tagirdzhanova-0007]
MAASVRVPFRAWMVMQGAKEGGGMEREWRRRAGGSAGRWSGRGQRQTGRHTAITASTSSSSSSSSSIIFPSSSSSSIFPSSIFPSSSSQSPPPPSIFSSTIPLPLPLPLPSLLSPYKTPFPRFYSSSSSSSSDPDSHSDSSLTGRLKTLTRRYGWATVAVYLLFSALDFSLVFFAINLVGADHVRQGQDYVLDTLVYGRPPSRTPAAPTTDNDHGHNHGHGQPELAGNGILGFLKDWREKHKLQQKEHAKDANRKPEGGGMWATAVLAYTIHKTLLLPLRIGATAAATPAIVKQFQKWGINIARSPIPEATRAKGAQAIKDSKQRLDSARMRHKDWL